MPVFLQNVACTVVGAKLHWERYRRPFRAKLEWLRETEWWPADRIREYQTRQLRKLIADAYRNVPYYAQLFDKARIRPEDIAGPESLNIVPILTKQAVREHQDDLVSREFSSLRLLRGLTSGTTGTPITVRTTPEGRVFQWAIWWRHRSRFGLTPGDRYLSFGARVAVPEGQRLAPFWRRNWIGRQTYLSTYHMTPRNLPSIVRWLNTEDFEFFAGYPSALYVLARFLEEGGHSLRRRPKVVVCGADALLPGFEATMARAFGVPITEQYGMAEFAGNLAKCEHGNFHLDFECCAAELHDIPGATLGEKRLILTGWGNPAMPFIRYDVGDYVRPLEGKCPCGRESQTFQSVDGRTEDYLRTPDGRMVIGLNQVLEYAPGAKEIQIVQKTIDEVEFRVVPGKDYGPDDERALTSELRRRVGKSIRIKFSIVDSIPRTPSGKFRAVVSHLEPGSNRQAVDR